MSYDYSCISWAADNGTRWWWPRDYYWPADCACEETIEAFVEAFSTLGYSPSENELHVEGVEKVAIYAIDDTPTHAARQLGNGWWTSKLGSSFDICHTLKGLQGSSDYGDVVLFLERPRPV